MQLTLTCTRAYHLKAGPYDKLAQHLGAVEVGQHALAAASGQQDEASPGQTLVTGERANVSPMS